ncbi:MAG: class I poly(R)-hydroxyalkanoic acid synthase [Sterolibacterium sp.]|nr:class I poly(R)-hydroxyalkanoic acid synthase [Sterolibacterium sp.]
MGVLPSAFLPSSPELTQLQQTYAARHAALWQAQLQRKPAQSLPMLVQPAAGDRRFSAPEWAESPIYDYLRQAYLLNAEFIGRLVELQPAQDEAERARLRFAARQYVDALAPSNFAATNPEFVKTAIDTQGESIQAGIQNLLTDIAKGRISMSDEAAFEVGRNLATTAGAVVFENELMQLIQYAPLSEQVAERPLVIIPPCINKYYILDLQPENSLVRHVVEQGHTVFLVSWRNPQAEQGRLRWDDYVEQGVLKALTVAQEICRVDQVNALGFCVGGTLLTTALAVAQARGEQPVMALTLLTTLLDFSEPGELGVFIDPAFVAAREASVGQDGLMKGSELASVFSSLRANDLIWQYVVGNYLKGGKPPAFDLLYWNADATHLPGAFATWYLRHMYLENALREPGRLTVCGQPLDLGKLEMPVFLYASKEDHIVPWRAAYRSRGLLGGKTTFVMGASGHIAGVINPPAKNKRSYWGSPVAEVGANADADAWLAAASEQRGSWWPAWLAWLSGFTGKSVKARARLGSTRYKAGEPAPGRYVKVKAS